MYNEATTEYIKNAGAYARPMLEYWRQVIHEECPEVTEVIKWGFPCFDYKGFLCGMTAHKAHCSFTFWRGKLLTDSNSIIEIVGKTGMGSLGKIQSMGDLPPDHIFREYLQEAVTLNEQGKKKLVAKHASPQALEIPEYFLLALAKNSQAHTTFQEFSYSNKKDYVEWVTEAKTEKTRDRRLVQAVEWMAEGKVRNWKYIKKR